MTQTSDHINGWLDKSRDYSAGSSTEKNELLRDARSLMMEVLSVLEPKAISGAQTTTVDLGSGFESVRSPIYETTTDEPGWTNGMLFAIITAKKMGVENFEITVKEEDSRRRRPPYGNAFNNPFIQQFNEEWQSSGSTTHKVTIYALRIK